MVWFSILMLVSTVSQARACAGRMIRRPLKVAAFVFLCLFIVFLSSGFNLEGNMDIVWTLTRGAHASNVSLCVRTRF